MAGMFSYTFHKVYLFISLAHNVGSFGTPSFESGWHYIEAQKSFNSKITIAHNLGEYPVLVDVQVRIQTNCRDYIFTGIGSGQRDDDLSQPYAGTVYIYNNNEFIITVPIMNNEYNTGGIAFAGSQTLYHGDFSEIEGPYLSGNVKVRAWLASDMPRTAFNMSVYMDTSSQNYTELSHGLGFYPDVVSVRTLFDDGYMSDAQGSVLDSYDNDNGGGLIYGYDTQKIYLWAGKGGIFSAEDGWGLNRDKQGGTVNILGWKINEYKKVLQEIFATSKSCIIQSFTQLPNNFDFSNYFMSVKVRSNDTGMIFNAVGSSMASGQNTYGGIVYAYTSTKIMTWQPKTANGHLIYVGGDWGSGQNSQTSDSVTVQTMVYFLSELQ